MKLNVIVILILLFTSSVFSQENKVLFTVNETPVTTNEFTRVYNKNIDLVQDEKQKDVNEYLNLYINYKLKLEEAYALELNKDKKYKNELNSYRRQLAKKYLTDTNVNEKLLKEAYERTINEVNVNHILVRVDENATAEDSLKAYNEVLDYRNKALKNGFSTVMQTAHNNKTVFGETLGYFNAFKMVYPFENIAYNTSVGEISMPFRTKFGFHILNVLEKRKSKGEVTVAHIMVAFNNKKLTTTAEDKINELYQKIIEGSDFSDIARQFSDDKNSAKNGGQLTRFGAGKLSAKEFEDVAFSLTKEEQISKPVKTKYGWHIIKLIKKHPVASFNELRSSLEKNIKKDSRSKIVNDKFYDNLKKRYDYSQVSGVKNTLLKIVDANFIKGIWDSNNEAHNETVATFASEKITYLEYYKYLLSKLRSYKNVKDITKIVDDSFNNFINDKLYNYHNNNLETEFTEFGDIVQEYREGLLLFELMEQEIWQKSKKDTLGLKKYYENNKTSYFWKERVEAIVTTSENKTIAKKVKNLLKEGTSIETLKKKENSVMVSQGMFELKDKEIPSNYKFTPGISKIFKHNNQYVVIKTTKKIAPNQKTFEEVKGRVINDYQVQLEKDWLHKLKQKYTVKVNQEMLDKVKQTL